ncbi:TonB-dependent receptor [Catenovulum sp. 2E275]|uniref:TonB-dependent receptor n=1 Tax=Catenovulum sp. 2E275 TaxID=2980497 RepID=UPI0021CF3709|nr:TonB-dependent receptor [Catenovulum sp. 2E275]MCU4677543.1 TonB-dependent receptor [Catenovulum sp. 2E275]
MNNTNLFKRPLATCISAVLAVSFSHQVLSQENEQAEVDEVISVKGIRGSLVRSMDLKRDTFGVMDAISAEEMGKFPDTNLAESLQRITGVTISRSNGEGSEITVRGFGPHFNLVTLNGRQMPGTGFTRSFNFENLSSEGVSTLEVVKTARAETPTGGLGATVNIVTAKPLQSPGEKLSVMGKLINDTSNVAGDDFTPEFAALYSNTFMDDTFGISANFSYHRRDFQQQSASIQGWHANVDLPSEPSGEVIDHRATDADGNPIAAFIDDDGNAVAGHFFPKDMNYSYSDVQRERINGQITLQYKPTDNLIITTDYTGSLATTGVETTGWGIWNNFGGNINAYELDENGTAIYADIAGDDGSFTMNRGTVEVDSRSIGLNLDWQATDNIHVELDMHDSVSKIDNGKDKGIKSNGQIILGSDKLETKIYDYRTGEIPHFEILWENGTNQLTASEIDSNFGQFTHTPGESSVQQVQLDTTWTNPSSSALAKLKGGVSFTKQELSGQDKWSGLLGKAGFSPSFVNMLPDTMFTKHDTGGFLDQFAGGGHALSPNYYYTYDFEQAIAIHEAYLTADVVGETDAFVAGISGIAPRSLVEEKTKAAYLQSEWYFDVANFPVQINAGIRYEESEVISPSESRIVEQVVWSSASEWITRFAGNGELQKVTNEGGYDVVLPMLDIKVDLTDDLVGRFSAGKSMTRPELGFLLGGASYTGSPKIGARTGSRGNTNLKPYLSTNIDLSLEYYYEDASYISVGLFSKEVDDWIDSATVDVTLDGVYDVYKGQRYNQAVAQIEGRGEQATDSAIHAQLLENGHGDSAGAIAADPSTDPLLVWSVSSPENVGTRKVHGAEFAIQHMFGESGFGTSLNATIVNGDVKYQPYILDTQTVLPGISDSANFQLFYEKDGLSIKTTYAWRDSYLIGQGQSQGSSEAPPQFAKAFGQWDLSINYDIDENFTVFFDGLNINNETEQGYGRFEEQFLFARQYGPRYTVGARYSF